LFGWGVPEGAVGVTQPTVWKHWRYRANSLYTDNLQHQDRRLTATTVSLYM